MRQVEGRPVEKIVRPFQDFAHKQTSGGIVLIIATVVALAWANSTCCIARWNGSGFRRANLDSAHPKNRSRRLIAWSYETAS